MYSEELNKPANYITITQKEYKDLLDDSRFMSALVACGVDSWEGWEDAIDFYNGMGDNDLED